MKKYLAFLFAILMLALAGCGNEADKPAAGPGSAPGSAAPEATEPPKASDHVVDYKVDIPEGFEETELEGVDACWLNPVDNSNVNLLITDKDATTDLGFKAITADMLRATVVSQMKATYDVEPDVTDRYFTKDTVCGLPAYQYSYELNLDGLVMTQIIVCINADKTYTFSYTTSDADTVTLFDASARNIQLILE